MIATPHRAWAPSSFSVGGCCACLPSRGVQVAFQRVLGGSTDLSGIGSADPCPWAMRLGRPTSRAVSGSASAFADANAPEGTTSNHRATSSHAPFSVISGLTEACRHREARCTGKIHNPCPDLSTQVISLHDAVVCLRTGGLYRHPFPRAGDRRAYQANGAVRLRRGHR